MILIIFKIYIVLPINAIFISNNSFKINCITLAAAPVTTCLETSTKHNKGHVGTEVPQRGQKYLKRDRSTLVVKAMA